MSETEGSPVTRALQVPGVLLAVAVALAQIGLVASPTDDAPSETPGWRVILLSDEERVAPTDLAPPEPLTTADSDLDRPPPSASDAPLVPVKAKVTGTLTTVDQRFGGCMVALDRPLADTALNCPGRWITLSCSGVHSSVDDALRKFESARTAFQTGRAVLVEVTDAKKHQGWCYGQRVDVLAR